MELKNKYTIVIVTHNMQQAARISDKTAFFLLGELVEAGPTESLFSMPQDKRTEDYITGGSAKPCAINLKSSWNSSTWSSSRPGPCARTPSPPPPRPCWKTT